MATLQELLTVKSPLENFGDLVATLASVGFPNTTTWSTGTVPNALLQTFGRATTDLQQSRFNYAAGGLLDYANLAGPEWLTQHADQVFNNQRFPATAAVLTVRFTDSAGTGPYTISPGGAGVSIGPGLPVYRTINTANVVLPMGGFVDISVRAPTPGASGNLPNGALVFFAAGVLPGVTVTNLATVVAGTDEEDAAVLATRCRSKWGLLGTGSPLPAYINWALFAGAGQVTKARPRTNSDLNDPGLVELYLAGPAGGVGAGTVTAVQTFIDPLVITGERVSSRIPETARCTVFSAINKIITVAGNVAVWPEYNNGTFLAQILADLASYQSGFPIGGNYGPDTGGTSGYVPYSRLMQILLQRSGVAQGPAQELTFQQIALNGLSASVPLAFNEVPVFMVGGLGLTAVPRVV